MVKKNNKKVSEEQHPNHEGEIHRLKRIIGQLQGIERMIAERRYCADILQQLRAVNSAVKSLEGEILKTHLNSCILASAKSGKNKEFEQKLKELLELIKN